MVASMWPIIVLSVVLLTCLAVSIVVFLDAVRGTLGLLSRIVDALGKIEWPTIEPAAVEQDPRVTSLLTRMDDLTTAVAEGIQNVRRAENRVRAVVKSARKELAASGFEDPGVEAEVEQLQFVDGGDGRTEPVPPVPEEVADLESVPSTIAGLSVAQVRRIRGIR